MTFNVRFSAEAGFQSGINKKTSMKRIRLFIALLLVAVTLSAHPWKPKYYAIVDTDCGFDDLRALGLMLASPEIRILAITTSNGVLDARTGYFKVKALLNDLHHEGLLVGASNDTIVNPAGCIPADNLNWGRTLPYETEIPTALEVVTNVLNNISEPVIFINLGSLNTAVTCMERCRTFTQRIEKIIWSSGYELTDENFNYNLDTTALYKLINHNMVIHLVSGDTKTMRYDLSMTERINDIGSRIASKISSSTEYPDAIYSKVIFDEWLPLLLHFPDMFLQDTTNTIIRYSPKAGISTDQIVTAYIRILKGETVNQNQIFDVFPMDTSYYFVDVQKNMLDAIEMYGKEEWIAGTITGELHRHLGVYAIIGVKMGIRAKEYFGAGIDEMTVVSYAGSSPPFSCMNDGLQVSTGATLGHGLIRIDSDSLHLPSAEFTYMNRKIIITLKPEYRQEAEQEITEYDKIFGLNSNIYWELVRNAAIRCWVRWDRNEIFDIKAPD